MIPDAAPTGYLLGLPALANYKPRKAAASASQFGLKIKQLVRLSLSIGLFHKSYAELLALRLIRRGRILFQQLVSLKFGENSLLLSVGNLPLRVRRAKALRLLRTSPRLFQDHFSL
jgi:hypothetical protein